MSAHDFYFSFPDRVLHYDCPSCTALCCRGGGFAAHAERELIPLLKRAPELAAWATGRYGKIVSFANPSSGCVFLQSDRRCNIEQEAGYAQKPSLCRAFPFNAITRLEIGDTQTLLVAPHYFCPLELRHDASASQPVAGDHAKVHAELVASGWLDQTFPAVKLAQNEAPSEFLRAEVALRDACAAGLRTARLDEVCREFDDGTPAGCAELFGWPLHVAPELEPLFLALAPTLSVRLSQLALPARRRALLLSRLQLAHALQVRGAPASLQTCYNLWRTQERVIEFLAAAPDPMPRGLFVDTADGNTLLAQAVFDLAAQRGASMLQALREGLEPLDLLDRYTLLQAVCTLHAERLNSAGK
ncbi:MAG: hypothetical protein RL701_5846 [Pseudomonadota bacterium]|jgi:Fe-S-cluster containining protein